jgi:uncharacterized protein YlzI (FlbEa/FlbD family)
MKFIKLTLATGEPILLNAAGIRSIYPATGRPTYQTLVSMGLDVDYCVKETYTDVLDKVAEVHESPKPVDSSSVAQQIRQAFRDRTKDKTAWGRNEAWRELDDAIIAVTSK